MAGEIGEAYARQLADSWFEINYLSGEVRKQHLFFCDQKDDQNLTISTEEKSQFYEYISKLLGLFTLARAKISNRDDCLDLKKEFDLYDKYEKRNNLLLADDNLEDMAKIHNLIGRTLEKLGIFRFED